METINKLAFKLRAPCCYGELVRGSDMTLVQDCFGDRYIWDRVEEYHRVCLTYWLANDANPESTEVDVYYVEGGSHHGDARIIRSKR